MEIKNRKSDAVSGMKWSFMRQFVVQASNLLIGILLTRLLSPEDFGLIAMITVFSGFLTIFQDFGFGSALIYKGNDVNRIDYNTVFFSQLILGIILATILFFSASSIAAFYSNNKLLAITETISCIFIVQSFGYVQSTKLKKEMNFKSIFYINSISILVSGTLAIVMAYYGFGVWSIVVKLLTQSILNTLFLWFFGNWKPKLEFSVISFKESLAYSYPLLGNKTVGYFMRNTDNILIGRFLGADALGIYSRAYSLMMLPITQITGVIANVMFPSFSLVKNNLSLIKSNWLKINRYIAFVLFPFSTLIIILADPFVRVVLGAKWIEAAPLIQILSFASAAQALTNMGFVFNALGKTKLLFKINLFNNSLLILAILIGVNYGILGVAFLYTLTTVIVVPLVRWSFLGKLIDAGVIENFTNIKRYLFLSLIIGIGLYSFETFYEIKSAIQLIIFPLLFMTFYFLLLYLIKDNTKEELMQLLAKNNKT